MHGFCTCDTGFTGPDCSQMMCPFGNSWGGTPDHNGEAHHLAECSDRGICDTDTGTCICQAGFKGGACEILPCPQDCSGHGQCMSMKDAAEQFNGFNLNRSVTYDLWDANQIYGCVCDHGFDGHDCSEQVCELGDDPRTSGGNNEVVQFFCQCDATCSGSVVLRYKLNSLTVAHDDTSSTFATKLMALAYSKSDSSVYSTGSPISVSYSVGTTACSAAGTTSSITFAQETGALPAMDIVVNSLATTATNSAAHFKTTQTLTCTCTGTCGGTFSLEMDDIMTPDLASTLNGAGLQTAILNLYKSINKQATVTIVATVASTVCVDSSTTTSTIEFQANSGNLPTLGVVSSLTDGGSPGGTMSITHTNRGNKENQVCNSIGWCNYDIGKCECGDYYTFKDAYGGCGAPVINTSSWTGVETCPGVVHQSDLLLAVDKPSSQPRLYYAQNTNKTNTGLHYYATGGDFDLAPRLISNMTNVTAGAVALDLSAGYVYFIDAPRHRIDRATLYNVSKLPNTHPYSGEIPFQRYPFSPGQASPPFGLALDLRWHNRYAYWTVPGVDTASDGQIKRCLLDSHSEPSVCSQQDLSSTIEAALGYQIKTPRGIALDLNSEKIYWVDAGTSGNQDGAVYQSNLDGTLAVKIIDKNLTDPYSIALDLVNGHMYIGERNETGRPHTAQNPAYGAIGRAKLGNSTLKWIIRSINEGGGVVTRIRQPDYLALDLNEDKIIFTDTGNQQIYFTHRSNYQTTQGKYIPAWPVYNPQGIAFDHGHGYPDASTPYYDCYGHGTCQGYSGNYKCECWDGWYGNCNMTTCPLGHAWFDEAVNDNMAHRPVECSDRGKCVRSTGECECDAGFTGAACERLECPSDELLGICSGRGQCLTMDVMARSRRDPYGDPGPVSYSYFSQTNKTANQLWDSHMIQACSCDVNWYMDGIWTKNMSDPTGYDCSQLTCPIGDDPNRPKSNSTLTEEYERQSLVCRATGGFFKLGFKGFNTDWLRWNIGAADLENKLEETRTFGNISVTFATANSGFCTDTGHAVNVTWYSELGEQPLIKYDDTRLTRSGGASIVIREKVPGSKQTLECSNHGKCNRLTGQCDCYQGYSSSDGEGKAGLRGDCGYFGTVNDVGFINMD